MVSCFHTGDSVVEVRGGLILLDRLTYKGLGYCLV